MTEAAKKAKRSAKPKAKPKARRGANGRPSPYRKEYDEQARKLSLLGATDLDLASFFEVSHQTIVNWKKVHKSFFESIRIGKDVADAEVATKLYNRALGYSHEEERVFNQDGQPIIVKTMKHHPPDTQAASLWLRNRQPAKWRDKVNHEVTGEGGGAVEHRVKVEYVD